MIPPSVSNFMPPDPTPAPQSGNDSRGAGDLFGDLLRNQLNVPAPGSSAGFSAPSAPAPSDPNPPQSLSNNPPPPPARNDDAGRSTPKSDSGSASAPPQQPASTAQSSSTSNSTDQNQQPTDSTNPATKSADGKPAGKKCSDEKNKSAKDDTNKTDSSANTAAAPVVVAALPETASAKPASGGDAQDDADGVSGVSGAGTAVGSDATSANTAKSDAAPVLPADFNIAAATPPASDQATDPTGPGVQAAAAAGQAGNGQIQAKVTVTDESKLLVSRPSSALASVNTTDGSAPTKPSGNSDNGKGNADDSQTGKSNQAASDKTAGAGDKTAADHGAGAHFDPASPVPTDNGAATLKTADLTAQPAPVQTQAASNTPVTAAMSVQTVTPGVNALSAAQGSEHAAHGGDATPTTTATLDQVAVQITKAATDGLDKINIQLKPESLGRIDVQLQVGHDGHVNATIAAHQQATLDLLRRDSYSLQRALQDAGLRTDAGSLSFNLSGQGAGNNASQTFAGPAGAPASITADAEPVTGVSAATIASSIAADRGGVDIRV